MVAFGVDEAGKGPVLGPMVAACVVARPESLPEGVADSKRLSPARRERLDAAIRDAADAVGVARVATGRIDREDTDMNGLTVAAHAEAIDAAGASGEGTVDAGDVDAARFGRRVADAASADVSIVAEHGADDAYPLVSAASVVAKVARDGAVEALAEEYGDVGSGYPSDPTTRAFLREWVREHGALPDCARASWQTARDALAEF
jgi:ribonuclease HII